MKKLVSALVAAVVSALAGSNVANADGEQDGLRHTVVEIKADEVAGRTGAIEIKRDIKDGQTHGAADLKDAKATWDDAGAEATLARDKAKVDAQPRK